jgi:selenophosphate synthetase-related protein
VVSVAEDDVNRVIEIALSHGVPYAIVGEVGGESLRIEGLVDAEVAALEGIYEDALATYVHPEETFASEELREG